MLLFSFPGLLGNMSDVSDQTNWLRGSFEEPVESRSTQLTFMHNDECVEVSEFSWVVETRVLFQLVL